MSDIYLKHQNDENMEKQFWPVFLEIEFLSPVLLN